MSEQFTILLVDDDANERSGVRFLIERDGYPLSIIEASNGQRALDIIRTQHVDVLFTDVKMPYIDGLELVGIVNREFPKIKIIVFSAYGEFEYAKQAMKANAINYLLKPVDIDEFQSIMKVVVERCQEEERALVISQRHIQADRKLQWILLLTGKKLINQETVADICKQGYDVERNITLMQIETLSDFFGMYEEQFLCCLDECIPSRYEYINLYPNSSYIVIFDEFQKDRLEGICKGIMDFVAGYDSQWALFVMDNAFPLIELSNKAQYIKEIYQQTYIWNSRIVFASDMDELKRDVYSDVEQEIKKISDSIHSGKKEIILENINKLLDTMQQRGAISSAYIQYVFYSILQTLYGKYGLKDSGKMERAVHMLGSCRTKQAIEQLFQSILQELTTLPVDEQDVSVIIRKIKHIVHNQYPDDISLDYLAEVVGLTPSYLSYVFKRQTGENLIKYITDYRMEKAKQMLDEHNLKINQISKACGYENQSYFNRLFKNTYGVTPKQYRENGND